MSKKRRPIPDPEDRYSPPNPSQDVHVDREGLKFRTRIFPDSRKFRDEPVPLDQLLSSLFYEIRQSRAEKAMFFASAIDRMGYAEGLWKNLMIFSFREINYGYPEASVYVYDYFCNWLEEMRRHREELACRLRFACSHAILARFPDLCERLKQGDPLKREETLRDFITEHLTEEERQTLLDDIRTLMATVDSTAGYPTYEHPCSCSLRKGQMMGDSTEYDNEGEKVLFSELGMSGHLTTARHLLFSIVNYLCVLPKTRLALDISFFTAFKCQGKLLNEDWDIRLSFSELDYSLFQLRKDREEAVQQLCVCLCASIVHQDEDRAVRITDLFHTWKEEDLFWSCLLILCDVFRDHYRWIRPYVEKYRAAWKLSDSCRDYFIEGCRTALFASVLLFVRGQPPRDMNQRQKRRGGGGIQTPNNLVLTPAQVQYGRDYVKIIYGSQTPSYEELSFLSEYSTCPTRLWDNCEVTVSMIYDHFHKEQEIVESMISDGDRSTTELLNNIAVRRMVQYIVPDLVRGYPGNPSSGKEPYVMKCSKDSTSVLNREGIRKRRYLSHSAPSIHLPNVNFRRMLLQSQLTSRRRRNKGGGEEERTALSIRREELEVPIDSHAVDWTTDLGRRNGKWSEHAFLISQGYLHDYRAQVDNKYFPKYEIAIREQEKNAKLLMKERNRLLIRGSEPIHSVSESEEERPFDVESMELKKLVRQSEDISRMPWYDPGLILLYRKIISDINKMEINWASQTPTLPIVRQSEFVLNPIDIKGGKEEVSTRNLGRDDILRRLDRLEGGGGRINEEDVSSISSSSLVSSMEDLCNQTGTLNLSRKRSHKESTEVEMSIEVEKEEVEGDSVFYSSEGRPDASNILYDHSLFPVTMKGDDSKVYIVLEPVTRSLYALISMGAFQKKENLHRFVVDMDLRDKFDMPNVYKELIMKWARIGYTALKMYLQKEMDLPEEGEGEEEEEGEEDFLSSITSSMDTLNHVRNVRIPPGYKKASEFVLDHIPFYPDCVLSNMTAKFGKMVPGAEIFHRGIATEEVDGGEVYYLHISVKMCKLPLIVTANPKSWERFTETLRNYFEEYITDHQQSLNFVTRDDTWLGKPMISEMLAYKIVECLLYSHMVKSNGVFSPVDFIESLVYTYTVAEGEDIDSCSLFVGPAPVYIDYLTMIDKEQDEYSEEYENFIETFQESVRLLEGWLPTGVFEHMSEMLYCDEGKSWVLDILAYWRSVLEEEEKEKEKEGEFTMDREALCGIIHRFTKMSTADRSLC